VDAFKISRRSLKVTLGIAAILFAATLPLVWPLLGKCKWIARIDATPMQVLYTILALDIIVAVYIWGVGNWSRYEPAKNTDDSALSTAKPLAGQQGGH
jgi:hypothetical protein